MIREIGVARDSWFEPLEDAGKVSGFVSPADDYSQRRLHIIHRLVGDPVNTYYFEMASDDMHAFRMKSGDLLIVDRSEEPVEGSIVVFSCGSDWLARKVSIVGGKMMLTNGTENIGSLEDVQYRLFGIVTFCCQDMRPPKKKKKK